MRLTGHFGRQRESKHPDLTSRTIDEIEFKRERASVLDY
jgi:hypothetical protein